jgi:hypothetical protein
VPASDRSAVPIGRGVMVAFGLGLALLTGALVAILSGSPVGVAGTNTIAAQSRVASVSGGFHACQMSGVLPRGTSGIRISASANTGPRVTVKVLMHGRLITSGEREAGWGVGETVTVPVKRVTTPVTNGEVCVTFGPSIERIRLNGLPTSKTALAGNPGTGFALRFEYLQPLQASWWSVASSVARRMGYQRAPSGAWVSFAVIALTIAMVVLVVVLVLRELR